MSKGFTLVEVLVAIVVIAIVVSMGFGVTRFVESSRISNTEHRLLGLAVDVQSYATKKGYPPPTLADLKADPGRLTDVWERPFRYSVSGKDFSLWSCGPDGVSGTADDIKFRRN